MKILEIDDDRALRDALRRSLSLGGYAVDVAENGQHGLSQMAAGDPDAFVLDMGMPGIDGLEVCRRLREARNRVPVPRLPRATRCTTRGAGRRRGRFAEAANAPEGGAVVRVSFGPPLPGSFGEGTAGETRVSRASPEGV